MADEPRPVSRRERRETEERDFATPEAQAAAAGGSVISAGYEYAAEAPDGPVATSMEMPVFAPPTGMIPTQAEPQQAAPQQTMPQQTPPSPVAPQQQAAPRPAPPLDLDSDANLSGMSRRDRRRLERLDNPIEEWTQEEEQRHTGQTPVITPEVIAQQEFLARQAAGQHDPRLATGQIPQFGTGAIPMAMPPAQQQGTPPGARPLPPGGVPPELQHLFPPGSPQQQAPRPPQQPPAMPSIGEFGQLVSPPGAGAPLPVPGFADLMASPGAGMGVPPAQQPSQQQGPPPGPQGGRPPAPPQASPFEELALGAQRVTAGAPTMKPPTMPITQVGAFQPPGPLSPGAGAAGMEGFPPPGMPPGQGMVIPATGTLRTVTSTGTMRSIPGTGAIPRPIVEVQPAGGASHFGWVQLTLIIAATFALGVVVWNVAQYAK